MSIEKRYQVTTQNGKSTTFSAPIIIENQYYESACEEYCRKLNNALKRTTGHRGSFGGIVTESNPHPIGTYGDYSKNGLWPCGKFVVRSMS